MASSIAYFSSSVAVSPMPKSCSVLKLRFHHQPHSLSTHSPTTPPRFSLQNGRKTRTQFSPMAASSSSSKFQARFFIRLPQLFFNFFRNIEEGYMVDLSTSIWNLMAKNCARKCSDSIKNLILFRILHELIDVNGYAFDVGNVICIPGFRRSQMI